LDETVEERVVEVEDRDHKPLLGHPHLHRHEEDLHNVLRRELLSIPILHKTEIKAS
jgi:hypothetical protein